jgi:hypothetical protein
MSKIQCHFNERVLHHGTLKEGMGLGFASVIKTFDEAALED